MQAFKTKGFARWARKEGLGDDALTSAVFEMEHGLIDVNLGGPAIGECPCGAQPPGFQR